MSRVYVFADEAGNFDFSGGAGASRFFIVGTVALENPDVGEEVLRLRRELAWKGMVLDAAFHASEDSQAVRNAVFQVIRQTDFRFDLTILDKAKTNPDLQKNWERFYKIAWFLHFKWVCPRITKRDDELLVAVASIGTKRRRQAIKQSVEDVVHQVSPSHKWKVAFWTAESDPCLQFTDYCIWAVQRKYERDDDRSYQIIWPKIRSEFNAFK